MSWPWWYGAAAAAPFYLPGIVAPLMGKPRPHLREFTPLSKDASPRVSVIVPARNEAANIERCLRSLLASEYPHLEIIVIDDRSTDSTGAIVARIARDDARVHVIQGAEVPEGWYGKPWACWQGYQKSAGELLLFTDADTAHSPTLLPLAVAARASLNADLFTVMPLQEMVTFWERVVQPFFFLMLGLRYGSLDRINRNRNPRHGIANGQFILVTRESYQSVGGHRAVHDTVLDDLMLAVRYLEAGRSTKFANAEDDMRTRMYDSLPGIVEGWSKNFFMGALSTMRSLPLAYLGILAGFTMPLAALSPLIALGIGLCWHAPALVAFGAFGYGAAALLFAQFLRVVSAPMAWALCYPAGAFIMMFILLRTALRGRRRIVWKGRSYSHP